MSDIFFDNELIDIELNYTVQKNKSGVNQVIILDNDKVTIMKADPLQREKVKSIKTKWRPLTWAASNEHLSRSTDYNHHTNEQNSNYTKFRDAKIKSCLVDWDCKDDTGQKIPCVQDRINKLHVNVALALLNEFDKAISPDPENQV